MSYLHFAQISDIHISSLGDHDELLSGQSVEILTRTLVDLNKIDDLDFVLITGDLFDRADHVEFSQFQQVIRILQKPYFIIPGNHDRGSIYSDMGLTRHQFAQAFNPQYKERPAAPEAQAGYWSVSVHQYVQLIGLDSTRDEDWGGSIDALQKNWLKGELAKHPDKLVIVAIHHPLHQLAPIDAHPDWRNFVCDCGPELLALLDGYPQVKLVLTGHHHLTKVDRLGSRLHIACPAICIYPCAYRTFRLRQQSDDCWQVAWQTHPAADKVVQDEAQEMMIETWRDRAGFELDFVNTHVRLAAGDEYDRNGVTVVKN